MESRAIHKRVCERLFVRRQFPLPGPFLGIAAMGGGCMLGSSSYDSDFTPDGAEDFGFWLIAWNPPAGGEGERVCSLPPYLSP